MCIDRAIGVNGLLLLAVMLKKCHIMFCLLNLIDMLVPDMAYDELPDTVQISNLGY
jgi:hypothetical protein